ncbi:hypothetical protein MC885_014423, partial [Smutsia gigantea]
HCQAINDKLTCEASLFWEKGFVAFQAAINAALIEVSIQLNETDCMANEILMEDHNKSFSDGIADVSYWYKYEDTTLCCPSRNYD